MNKQDPENPHLQRGTEGYSHVLDVFFDHIISPLMILDKDFNILRVNEAYNATHQWHSKTYIGRNYFDIFPSESNQKIFQQVVVSKKAYTAKSKPLIHNDNLERDISYWDWSLSPVLDDAGELLLILSLYDVTDRVKAISDLQRFFDFSIDMLCMINQKGNLTRLNGAWERNLGYSMQELNAKKFIDYVYTEDKKQTKLAITSCFAEQNAINDFQNRLVCKDNSVRWLEWVFVPDVDRNLIYANARDITERKHMEEEMFRLERLNLIGEMAAGISHEVRNPMATVRGFLQILGQKEECAFFNEFFEIMIEELDRANSIITEFLSLGRNNAPEMKRYNLNAIIQSLLPLVQADALCYDKYVECELEEIPDLMLDDKEIRQVILNLVRNGLEAMSKGGQVMVSTTQTLHDVILSVADQGSGIPMEIMEKLGTPFLTTKKKGTGLGLATCYSIANRHGAELSVDTSSEGTIFHLMFKKNPLG